MIVNVRGTNGSGKSTISRLMREQHPHELVIEPTSSHGKNFKKPNATVIEGGLIIVGRTLSGCDGIFPQEIVEDMIRLWAPRGHLIWENVLVSGNVGRWGRLAHELEPVNHSVWATLDTPFETCISRIYERRARREAEGWKHRQKDGKIREDQIETHWKRVRRVAVQAVNDGIDVRWIDHNLAYEMVHDMLVRAGWNCPVHGLLLPEGPYLEPWTPTESEKELVTKTTRLPWEPQLAATEPDNGRALGLGAVAANPSPVAAVGTVSMVEDPYELGDPFDV